MGVDRAGVPGGGEMGGGGVVVAMPCHVSLYSPVQDSLSPPPNFDLLWHDVAS